MARKKVMKNKGKVVKAWELGSNSLIELQLLKEGKIIKTAEGYELFSQECVGKSGERAHTGDFFKVDSAGFPYPNKREWFFSNHRHISGNDWEQLPKPLLAWEAGDKITPEVEFLINHKGLVLSPSTPSAYFGAKLWGAWETAAADAVLVFYSISYDNAGTVMDADFNFVARTEFKRTYHYCK